MIKALISDVSKVLLFPQNKSFYGSLNALYKEKLIEKSFSFFDHFVINTELLDFYKSLKPQLNLFILTSDTIQDAPELQPYWESCFDKIFSASKMGTHKSKPETYEKVLNTLHYSANEVIYVDDNETNIKASLKAGLKSLCYKNNDQVIKAVSELLK